MFTYYQIYKSIKFIQEAKSIFSQQYTICYADCGRKKVPVNIDSILIKLDFKRGLKLDHISLDNMEKVEITCHDCKFVPLFGSIAD